MTATLIFAGIAFLLLLALIWLAREVQRPKPIHPGGVPPPLEELFPLHCQHFPQIAQALSRSDAEYLRLRVSRASRRRALAERCAVVRRFLLGLREDFRRLDQLGRTIAALSPEVHHVQEAERVRLALRFEFLYRRVQLRLLLGGIPVPLLARVADLVSAQAAQIEAAMSRLEELSAENLRPSFSA